MSQRASALALGTALLAGCNAIFDINAGRPRTGCDNVFVVDDMEDGDGEICDTEEADGRKGSWFTTDDGTGIIEPALGTTFVPTAIPDGPTGRSGSRFAAHMTGSGFEDWGAMGFTLNAKGLGVAPYDASRSDGITFWLKSNAPIAVELPIPATIPMGEAGGRCADTVGRSDCGNHFQFLISAPDPYQWREYWIPFAALSQVAKQEPATGGRTFGSTSWTAAELVGAQFVALQSSFDVWIDDVHFDVRPPKDRIPTCTDPTATVGCAATGEIAAGCWPEGTACDTVPVLANTFMGVWGAGPGDLQIVGSLNGLHPGGTVAGWNGSAWSATSNVSPAILAGVWGSGPDDIWVVGDHGTILRAKGAGWESVGSGTTQGLQSVWGCGSGDVWAVGHGGTIVHWDGGAWTTVPSGTTSWLQGVGGSGPGDVWAVGQSETGGAGFIVHWDGSTWKAVSGGGSGLWFGVWAGAPDDAWAVGATVSAGITFPAAAHWNGTRWSQATNGALLLSRGLRGVWGSGPADVWAVGDDGIAVHWNGAIWSLVPTGTTHRLFRVWGTGANDVWAVGDLGTIVHWNGSAWALVPPGAIKVRGI